MAKQNCWELTGCGREPGGRYSEKYGACPAAIEDAGKNGGTGYGRACWMISGTFCEGETQGTFEQKNVDCVLCDVYRMIQQEEGEAFEIL